MNRKFDEVLKKKLDNYDSKYPDHMWESIAKNLPEKKRKPYYIWFLVVFIALIAYGVLYYSFSKLNDGNAKGAFHNRNIQENSIATENPSNSNDISTENSIIESGTISDGIVSQKEINNDNNSISSKSSVEKSNTSIINSKKHYKQNALGYKPNNEDLAITEKGGFSNSGNSSLKNSSALGNSQENENSTNSDLNNSNFNNEELQKRNSWLTNFINTSWRQEVLSQLATNVIKNDLEGIAKKHSSLACPTFVKKQNTNTLEFYFSNDFAQKSLDIKRGDGLTYLNQREQTEVSHLSNSFGFRLGMGWESGIAFKTGLNYLSINEKFIYTDPNSIQKKTITVVKYIYDDNLVVVDSTITQEVVEIPGTNTIVSKNRYSFIDIPVLFQYSIPGKKRLSYDLTVGPFINLLVNQSGKILGDNGKKIIQLDSDDGSRLFKDNVGVSFYGSVAINYQLTKQMKISLEPNVRYMPASITSFNNNLDQKYLIAGIAAGVKMRI